MNIDFEKLNDVIWLLNTMASGTDPLTGELAETDCFLRDAGIQSDIKYASEMLGQLLMKDAARKSKKEFFVTQEQMSKLSVYDEYMTLNDMCTQINSILAEEGTGKVVAAWINEWLIRQDIVEVRGKYKYPSEKGTELGIISDKRQSPNIGEYFVNMYNSQAQRFVYDNIDKILSYHFREKYASPNGVMADQNIPYRIKIEEFVKSNEGKCIIACNGSYHYETESGAYNAVLCFKGHKKRISSENIEVKSANRAILLGLIECVKALKNPVDTVIITSVRLGFRSPKNINSDLCMELIDLLKDKNCRFEIYTCEGRGTELNMFIKE